MPAQTTTPWRCWERTTLAGVLNGPEDLLVRVALYDRRSRIYQTEFRWPALVRLGPNDYQGRYAQVSLRFGDVRWSFEITGDAEKCCILTRPLDSVADSDIEIQLETLYLRPNAGQVVGREQEVIARSESGAWRVWSPSPAACRRGSTIVAPLSRPFLAIVEPATEAGRRLESRTEKEHQRAGADCPLTTDEQALLGSVAKARQEYLDKFSYVPESLWWAYAAVVYGIGWNMIWAEDRQEPVQVCSRDWCVHGNYSNWVLFNWDTFPLVAAAAEYDVELAHQIAGPQMAVQTPEGLIPGVASPLGISADRGMPPVASLGFWRAYQRSGDRSFVERYYEPLLRYHDWWRKNRMGRGDGLLQWGSNPTEAAHPQWQSHSHWASRYETGMDNHPMWDGVPFNAETNTQEQDDVGLSALHALDALCLARMADLMGDTERAKELQEHGLAVGRLIEERLWNDELGLWLSRGWDGKWNYRASPICFYPIFLPTTSPERIQRAIENHLLAPNRFGGRYLLPVSPRDDPAYAEQYYVRGRIWPEQALLIHGALREANQEAAALRLAQGCLETMRAEWLDEGHLHENYHADTADGDDTPESDPLYSFGLMMVLPAWYHLRDLRLDGSEVSSDVDALSDYLDLAGVLRPQVELLEAS